MKRLFIMLAILFAGLRTAAQDLSVSSNMLDVANMGTMNLEASYGVARHWTIMAGMKYNPFSYDEGEDERFSKQQSYSAGVRYWPWHVFSGWWLSGALRYQEYRRGGISSRETVQGDRYGGGIGGGYTYMVNPHLNLDFGIALWGGYDVFTTYACQTCGAQMASGEKYFFQPSDIILAVTYIF